MVAEQESDGERASEPRKHRSDGILRGGPALDLASDQMPDHFGVGLALKLAPFADQLVAQRLEILDDPVVHQRDRTDDMWVGIADGRRTMRRPARVGDSDGTMQRVRGK